jgi:Zn-dependent protease with chaperone function
VEELMRGVGISKLDLREVSSQGQWTGAAVVGWLPATRQLWLGDGLLEKLSSQELDMVLLHELAHIQCGHHWRRVFPVGVALGFGVCGFASCGFWLPEVSTWLAPIFAMLICICTLVVGLGVTSRECELEADRVACRTAAACCEWSGGHQQSAALSLGSALIKLTGPGNRSFRQRNWLHPSLRERLSGLALELSKQRE